MSIPLTRCFWFHARVKAGIYPNATTLANKFEIDPKTAHRSIEYMRDQLEWPLFYDKSRRGWYYEDHTFELPAFLLKDEEITALILSLRLASTIPEAHLKSSLRKSLQKVIRTASPELPIGLRNLEKKISVKNVSYYQVDQKTFHGVLEALLKEKSLEIRYYSPHKHEYSERKVDPLHLLHYMGNWHLIAFCHMRKGLRDFSLSRIQELKQLDGPFVRSHTPEEVKVYLDEHFGLFHGAEKSEVVLRFSPGASRWVREQLWHPDQSQAWENDRLVLRIPVGDTTEIKREILKFGADVEVLGPDGLRDEVRAEIARMKNIYA